ncbi:MAG: EexN family lipoprotein [Sphingobium sp.]
MRKGVAAIGLAGVLGLGLAACESEKAETQKNYTVQELLNDPATLKRIYDECSNDPGRLSQTPNCQNAAQANWKYTLQKMNRHLAQ